MVRRGWWTAALALLLCLSAASWWMVERSGPTAAPDASAAELTRMVEPQAIRQWLDSRGDIDTRLVLDPPRDHQVVAGTLSIPHDSALAGEDHYALFVIDERFDQVATEVWAVPFGTTSVSRGWEGRYDEVAEANPALSSVASIQRAGGSWTDPGTTLALTQEQLTQPLDFVAWLSDSPVLMSDPDELTIALAAWDEQGDLAWSTTL